MDAQVNTKHLQPLEAKPNLKMITANAAMSTKSLTAAGRRSALCGPAAAQENLLAESQLQSKERDTSSTKPGAHVTPVPAAAEIGAGAHNVIEPAPKALLVIPLSKKRMSMAAGHPTYRPDPPLRSAPQNDLRLTSKNGGPAAAAATGQAVKAAPVSFKISRYNTRNARAHLPVSSKLPPTVPCPQTKDQKTADVQQSMRAPGCFGGPSGANAAPKNNAKGTEIRSISAAGEKKDNRENSTENAAAELRNAHALLTTVPKANVIVVNTLSLLTAAICTLFSCNLLGFDTRTRNCPMDNRYSMASPSFIQIAGVRLHYLQPGPKIFSADDLRVTESESERTFVFDLTKLLPVHGGVLSNFVGLILADPHIFVIGVEVVYNLRAFARGFACCVPSLYAVAFGVQDIGKLVGRSESWDLQRICATVLGLRLEDKPRVWRPWDDDWLEDAANGARLALMAYVAAGSETFAGNEVHVELEIMPAWRCEVCGNQRLSQKRPPAERIDRDCQRKWIAEGKAEHTILRPIVVRMGGREKLRWQREKEPNLLQVVEQRKRMKEPAKRTAPEIAGDGTFVTKRARTEKSEAGAE